MSNHEYTYPKVTEIAQYRQRIEHDPFIDDLAPDGYPDGCIIQFAKKLAEQPLAEVIELRPTNLIEVDFKNGKRA